MFLSDSLSGTRENNSVFHLDLRSSGGIASVEFEGFEANYEFDEETSTLTILDKVYFGKKTGKITFADGGVLEYEIKR